MNCTTKVKQITFMMQFIKPQSLYDYSALITRLVLKIINDSRHNSDFLNGRIGSIFD